MKPLQLKELAKCCGMSILVWNKTRCEFNCACGKMRVDMNGVPLRIKHLKSGKTKVSRDMYAMREHR